MDIDPKKLRQLRVLRGWSQAQFAEISGVSPKTVRRAEQGAKSSLQTLKALAAALETDISDIVRDPAERHANSPAFAPRDGAVLGQCGLLLAAINDVLGEMHHWRRHFADLFRFRGFFYREPDPPLYVALEAAQPLAATVSYQLHRDVADGLASLKRLQHIIASTSGFVRSTARFGYHIPPEVQTDARIEGHAQCEHVEFYLSRAKRDLIARVYPEG